jgi:hypothetical protein
MKILGGVTIFLQTQAIKGVIYFEERKMLEILGYAFDREGFFIEEVLSPFKIPPSELPPLHSGPQSHPKSNPRSDLWASRSSATPPLLYFLGGTIASLAALAILIFTTVLAGILIVALVAGLRPMRAFLFTRTSFPIPGRVKEPAFLVSEMANAATSSMIPEEVFLVSSNFPAK